MPDRAAHASELAVRSGSPLAWPWSSYAPTVGLAEQPAFLTLDRVLHEFDPNPQQARAAIRRFVEEFAVAT